MTDSNPVRHILKLGIPYVIILGLLLSYLGAWASGRHVSIFRDKYNEIIHPKENAELVILGDSYAEIGVNPMHLEVFNLRVFNFGYSGSPPSFFWDWYHKLFRAHYPRPKIVLYCVNWVMFTQDRKFEQDSVYFPAGLFWRECFDPAVSKKILWMNRFSVTKYGHEIIPDLMGIENDVLRSAYKGFHALPLRNNWLMHDKSTGKKSAPPALQVNEDEIRIFDRLIDRIKEDGITVIFVNMPNYIPESTAEEERFRLKCKRMFYEMAKAKGISLVDFSPPVSSSLTHDRTLYHDRHHLNGKGAQAFSKLLQEDLKDIFSPAETRP
ncbi:MAG: hypothetical protein A3A86_04760 [Elusimicrobia bacterium RIFCSPLOWO2_01_FULL_60_11]|nr:MAG: hypothetical protein A3A86_04760 [Elusimicrobia bacterium RIFCSPLOWO2_01_FULL_60_11]